MSIKAEDILEKANYIIENSAGSRQRCDNCQSYVQYYYLRLDRFNISTRGYCKLNLTVCRRDDCCKGHKMLDYDDELKFCCR